MKTVKMFNSKKILIREISRNDLKRTKDFLNFINSLVKEDAQILYNKRVSLKEEKEWLKKEVSEVKKRKRVVIIAEDVKNRKIVGICDAQLRKYRQSHVCELGISIRKEYRGIGLGKFLMKSCIQTAKERLKPKIFRLSVFSTNKIAINLYKKLGFKKVARIPKQLQYKNKLVDEIVMIREA